MTPKLLRPFSPTQQKIAEGIAAGRSYRQIGKDLGGRKPRTVRGHVEDMAMKLDGMDEDLEPRVKVYLYLKHLEWEAVRQKK